MAIREAQFRKIVEDWGGVTLDVKWETHLVACIDARMFAMLDVLGEHAGRLHFKVEDELFLPLTEQPGIVPAAYLARAKWVTVVEPRRYAHDWYAARLRRAYELVAAKLSRRRRRELGLTA